MYEFIVEEAQAGRKLSSLLGTTHGMSRKFIRRVIRENGISRNGQPVLLSAVVEEGDRIQVQFPVESSSVQPEKMPIQICYEDVNVLVVNKPAGILTHPSAKEKTGSLLAGVAHYLAPAGLIPHSVHRLDKFTSGAILYAKHAHAHHLLDVAMRSNQVHRQYVALAYTPSDIPIGSWHTLEDYIAQDPNKPSRRIIGNSDNGQLAITHMQAVARVGDICAYRFRLETGRTHQIRLQMASRGLPLVGDRDYTYDYSGQPGNRSTRYCEKMLPHQALHAYQLTWQAKNMAEPICVYAKPAADLEEIWALIGAKATLHELLEDSADTL